MVGIHTRGTKRFRSLIVALCLVSVLLAGCSAVTVSVSPTASATATAQATASPTASLSQRIDAYIAHLSLAQQIGQLLMVAVYTNGYDANLNQALTQWHIGSAIVFTNYNGGPLEPATLAGMQQLVHDLQT
ncbi:MAG: hypothetical protein ACRDHP_13565, partial [Ktedonobacterales bacterium]